MTDFQIKFKFIFLRYLLIAVGFVGIYTFLNWWLVLNKDAVRINENIINIIIPLALAFLPVLIWLRPRIKLLVLNNTKHKDPAILYIMLAGFTIGTTTVMAQNYTTVATGKLTQLESINTIHKKPLTKYYTLNHHFIGKQYCRTYETYGTTDKGHKLDWNYYIVSPIYADSVGRGLNPGITSNDGSKSAPIFITPKAWLGVHYFKEVSNSLNKAEKDTLEKEFLKNSFRDFKWRDQEHFIYLDRIGYGIHRTYYTKAINYTHYFGTYPIIFEAAYQPFEARYGNKLTWLAIVFAAGSALLLFIMQFPQINKQKLNEIMPADPGSWDSQD
jgi:rhomboid protease GluP